MKLSTKITLLVAGVLALAVVISMVAVFSTRQLGRLMEGMVTENLSSIKAAEELEIALLEQRGFVSYYILDQGNQLWLEELESKRQSFEQWLVRASQTAHSPEEEELIRSLEAVYRRYDEQRNQAITFYQQGHSEAANQLLLHEMKSLYNQAYDLCEAFLATNERIISAAIEEGRAQIWQRTLLVGASVGFAALFSLGLLWFFFHGILTPLQQMAREARTFSADNRAAAPGGSPQDELREVGFYLKTLMSDVSETRTSLEHSRNQLLQAEKLASVGKLAASVAHEIRNPLTSLKMRLYSLRQAFGTDPLHSDDFQVVSDEISRLERIIRSFLEFSRPPELQLQPQPLAPLLDRTLDLCGHRLFEKDLALTRQDGAGLPEVLADADQLKQVFINLLNNASEALPEGGQLLISSAPKQDPEGRAMVVVRFADNGPGIPPELQAHVFEPFFTTKDEGTGLGLCIAARIMARHQGRLVLESSTARGSTFAVWIPVAREREG
ncbi:MAG: MCP four helix bundle domain-containing protein [Candidatus Latescibacteria bacterium]|nr:MCP four helix bundle domain-containing protein [Candidatus Latescibacterota bacterium]